MGGPFERVLIVDESPAVTSKVADIIEGAGIPRSAIRTAGTADEAVSAFTAGPAPTFLVSELVGSTVEGLKTLRRILVENPRTYVVLATAEPPSSAVVREAVRFGVFAVVHKPLRAEELRQVLDEAEAEDAGLVTLR